MQIDVGIPAMFSYKPSFLTGACSRVEKDLGESGLRTEPSTLSILLSDGYENLLCQALGCRVSATVRTAQAAELTVWHVHPRPYCTQRGPSTDRDGSPCHRGEASGGGVLKSKERVGIPRLVGPQVREQPGKAQEVQKSLARTHAP